MRVSKVPKVGDIVLVKISGRWCEVIVLETDPSYGAYYIVQRVRTPDRKVYPRLIRTTGALRPLPRDRLTTANVFADFLEEQGELSAAEKLRKAFPLG